MFRAYFRLEKEDLCRLQKAFIIAEEMVEVFLDRELLAELFTCWCACIAFINNVDTPTFVLGATMFGYPDARALHIHSTEESFPPDVSTAV